VFILIFVYFPMDGRARLSTDEHMGYTWSCLQ